MTLDSAFAELGLTGNLTETAPTTRDGLTVIGIRGTDSSPDSPGGTGTMYVTATDPLPVEFDSTSSEGTEQVQLSGWGESVDLFAPDDALTIATAPKASGLPGLVGRAQASATDSAMPCNSWFVRTVIKACECVACPSSRLPPWPAR